MTQINENVNATQEQTQVELDAQNMQDGQNMQDALLRAAETLCVMQMRLDSKEQELRKQQRITDNYKAHNEKLKDDIGMAWERARLLHLRNIANVLEYHKFAAISAEQACDLIDDLVLSWREQD